mmetsp:Transcript_12198/g.50479  ORF Transcript_12198/g.50479 Transcript_12198/m.50479 type:complete len:317 (-) Transcript_12198:2380-3330(-)|eukprot:CAMPEP_0113961062 /NCGR_PEP_ID=MMETSP0011_2-20120614/5084_1 /TAXON_ID=101924 /ORGANISM="Rhodosorus marinus" /LENGTH=316 /DNA_ID=CAMNT_0000972629 /DNA_START=354 /DNA_END=1304 /DNA_ORIENTATION=- /assembly_acc=CAM_ASM_000156
MKFEWFSTLVLVFLGLSLSAYGVSVKICTYTDTSCSSNEQCVEGDNGSCLTVSAENTSEEYGARAECTDSDDPSGVLALFPNTDCSGSVIIDAVVDGFCSVVNPLSGSNFFVRFECQADVCFSAYSSVRMSDGETKRVQDVEVGDSVESVDSRGRRTFSEVYLVQHEGKASATTLRQIHYSTVDGRGSGAITLSGAHMLRSAKEEDAFVSAKSIEKGSTIFVVLQDDMEATEALVTGVSSVRHPVRNIHTMNDRIVVDGVVASSTTELVPFSVARLLLAPLKLLYKIGLHKVVTHIDAHAHELAKTSTGRKVLSRL